MTVDIPHDCTSLVEQLIADGTFDDTSSIIAEGIRLVAAREQRNAQIEAGLQSLDQGQRIPASEVFAAARERLAAIEKDGNR